MGDNDLQITIQAVDKANAVLSSVKTQLNSLNGVAANAGKQAGASLSAGMTPGVQAATQVLRQVSPTLASIASAAGPAAAAIAAVTAGVVLYKQAWGMAVQGANFQEVYDAQMKIVGSTAKMTEMLNLMRKATVGTVSDFDLLIIENRALNMGVTQSAEKMANLAAIFTNLGDASGIAAKEAVSAGFQALGALQTRGLKTIGLSIDETKVWDEYAAKLGTTATKLDDVQKRAALVQAVLATAPNALNEASASYADQVDAMKVAQENFRTELGRTLQEMLNIAPTISSVMDKATGYLRERRQIESLMEPYYKKAQVMDISSRVDMEKQRALRYELNLLASQAEWGAITFEQLTAALAALDPVTAAAASGEAAAAASLGAYAFAAMNAESATLKLASAQAMLARMDYLSSTYNAPGGYPTGKRSAMGLPEGVMLEGIGFTPSKWSYSSPRSSSLGSGGIGGGGGGMSEYESMLQQQAVDMRSLVEQILQPTDITPQDMADTAAGRYMDKWDEYARKMKSIAADQGSVWRQMVPQDILAQGEDAIRGWAEQQEKLFYAGRMPGEINWGDFVARAKEEIANKQAREALVQEAMRQLQAAGVSMSGADVQSLMGGTPGASTGVEMAGAFGTGLVANDTAAAVTKAFQEQMAAQQKTWELVGSMCIAWFAAGLKMGVTAETGKDIIAALWPWIAEMMNREAPLP